MNVTAWTFLLLFPGLAVGLSLGFWGLLTANRGKAREGSPRMRRAQF